MKFTQVIILAPPQVPPLVREALQRREQKIKEESLKNHLLKLVKKEGPGARGHKEEKNYNTL